MELDSNIIIKLFEIFSEISKNEQIVFCFETDNITEKNDKKEFASIKSIIKTLRKIILMINF